VSPKTQTFSYTLAGLTQLSPHNYKKYNYTQPLPQEWKSSSNKIHDCYWSLS